MGRADPRRVQGAAQVAAARKAHEPAQGDVVEHADPRKGRRRERPEGT
jgi:hypothetical protein